MTSNSENDSSVYNKLVETLNKIPEGFILTEDGTHIRVLKWLFTEEEADIVRRMKLWAETVEELSERLDLPLPGLVEKLEAMINKGLIHAINTSTGRRYGLMPYVVGIYEEQVERMDKEFAQLQEDLFQKGKYSLFEVEPPIFKVIPVNQAINTELVVHPYEKAEQMIENAKSWGVRECICKKQQGLLGKPCSYPSTVCLVLGKKENQIAENEINQVISKEQAVEYLYKAEKAGLVHCSMNIQSGHYYICNCCSCCCAILRAVTERNEPFAYVNSNYQISIDEELCVGCGVCVDRCQFDALEVDSDMCTVDLQRCVGCGVCAIECPEDALSLVERAEKSVPPVTARDWMTQKAMSRKIDPSDLL